MRQSFLSSLLILAGGLALGACASGVPADSGFCGDGLVQAQRGEQCDDGNTLGGDGCSAGCISEAGAEIHCGNGVDDDGDGLTDCADPGCLLSPLCSGTGETLCDNGLDDDQDSLTDCMDPDCGGRACGTGGRVCSGILCQCPTGLSTETTCTGGQDDDCDGLVDCQDPDCGSSPDCANVESNCANGLDDDGDGLVDCADSDCASLSCDANGKICTGGVCTCPGGATETACADGVDNDCDGLIDCADTQCSASPSCVNVEANCSNGLDDDGDTQMDCADSDCANQTCAPNGKRCSGGVCACPSGTTESSCTDAQDNDCDGLVDCADSDCANLSCGPNGRLCQGGTCVCPGGSTEVCGDSVDNNCDGQVDEGCSTGTCTNPLSPAAECGSGAHCMPTTTSGAPGQCQSPAGYGTQYSYCTTDADCAPTYACVDTGGTFPYCLQFCTTWTQCPDTVWEDCYFFLTPKYVYSQEWGACWDGF